MPRKLLTGVTLLILATVSGWEGESSIARAGLVTYESAPGVDTAFGLFILPHGDSIYVQNQPVILHISYDTTGPMNLDIWIAVNYAYFGVSDPNGEFWWDGNALSFIADVMDSYGDDNNFVVTFPHAGALLTPGVLPDSLNPLVDVPAEFSGTGGDSSASEFWSIESTEGTPEPSSLVMLALGIVAIAAARAGRSRRRFDRVQDVEGRPPA